MIYEASRTKSRTQWAKELKDTEYKTFSYPTPCKYGHPALFSVSEGGKCVECVKLKDRNRYAKKLGLTLPEFDQKQEAERKASLKRKANEQLDTAIRKFQRQTERLRRDLSAAPSHYLVGDGLLRNTEQVMEDLLSDDAKLNAQAVEAFKTVLIINRA